MLDLLCGAFGLLGLFILAVFLYSEAEFGSQEGGIGSWGQPYPLYGCALAISGPLIVAGLIPVVGLRWSLLGPAAELLLLVGARGVGRVAGSRRAAVLRHARSDAVLVRRLGVEKLVARRDLAKDPEALQALADALGSGDSEIVTFAAVALTRLGQVGVVAEALARPFLDPGRSMRDASAVGSALRELGPDAAIPILGLLESPSTPFLGRHAIFTSLHGIKDERVVRVIRRVAEDPDPRMRAGALEWLRRDDPVGSGELLRRALRDSAGAVRIVALHAVRILRNRSVADEVVPLTEDAEPTVRRVAIEVLGGFEDPRVAAAAIRALTEPDEELRRQAILALGKVRPAEAVEPLLAALEDPAMLLRSDAAEALRKIGDRRACPALARTIRTDPWYAARAQAALALESMGWKPESPEDQAAWALAMGIWEHPFEPDANTLAGFQAALKDADAARGALPRLARLLEEKPAGISDALLWSFSQLDQVLGPELKRGGPQLLDCDPVRKAARAEIARRASATR
jgi:HEAT repeat protein